MYSRRVGSRNAAPVLPTVVLRHAPDARAMVQVNVGHAQPEELKLARAVQRGRSGGGGQALPTRGRSRVRLSIR